MNRVPKTEPVPHKTLRKNLPPRRKRPRPERRSIRRGLKTAKAPDPSRSRGGLRFAPTGAGAISPLRPNALQRRHAREQEGETAKRFVRNRFLREILPPPPGGERAIHEDRHSGAGRGSRFQDLAPVPFLRFVERRVSRLLDAIPALEKAARPPGETCLDGFEDEKLRQEPEERERDRGEQELDGDPTASVHRTRPLPQIRLTNWRSATRGDRAASHSPGPPQGRIRSGFGVRCSITSPRRGRPERDPL